VPPLPRAGTQLVLDRLSNGPGSGPSIYFEIVGEIYDAAVSGADPIE
jgi:hypothetical protein